MSNYIPQNLWMYLLTHLIVFKNGNITQRSVLYYIASQIIGLSIIAQLFFFQAQINGTIKDPSHWPLLCYGIHRWLLDPPFNKGR